MPILVACSGPGVSAAIVLNLSISPASAIVVGVLPGPSRGIRRDVPTAKPIDSAAYATLLILHPAWWVGASSGDCGGLKSGSSLIVGGIAVVVAAARALATAKARSRTRAASGPVGPTSFPPPEA